jgi:hypothetical protein
LRSWCLHDPHEGDVRRRRAAGRRFRPGRQLERVAELAQRAQLQFRPDRLAVQREGATTTPSTGSPSSTCVSKLSSADMRTCPSVST